MNALLARLAATLLVALAGSARAHHGTAAVSVIGAEGPGAGAALDGNLERDREDGTLRPSGGTILYGQLGARALPGSSSIGATVKRSVARSLNEWEDQQGAEGLESHRASLVLGSSVRL